MQVKQEETILLKNYITDIGVVNSCHRRPGSFPFEMILI